MAVDLAPLSRAMPPGLMARTATAEDIERVTEYLNRYATPAHWTSPASARAFEEMSPEPNRLALVVEDDRGGIQAFAAVTDGGMWASPDRSWRVVLRVAPAWRRRGVGHALLTVLDAHAREHGAARVIAAIRGDEPEGVAFAKTAGYSPFHERIDAYIEIATFDPSGFEDPDAIASRAGVRLASYAELVREHGEDLEGFQRELLPAIWSMARDVPSPTPMPEQPPPFEQARRMFFEPPNASRDATIFALRGDRVVGVTATIVKDNDVAYTNFTGVAREERRKGIALALKLRALRELKTVGARLFGTTNDEQNAAMRGINRRLGYRPDPPTTVVEKKL